METLSQSGTAHERVRKKNTSRKVCFFIKSSYSYNGQLERALLALRKSAPFFLTDMRAS